MEHLNVFQLATVLLFANQAISFRPVTSYPRNVIVKKMDCIDDVSEAVYLAYCKRTYVRYMYISFSYTFILSNDVLCFIFMIEYNEDVIGRYRFV